MITVSSNNGTAAGIFMLPSTALNLLKTLVYVWVQATSLNIVNQTIV